MKIASVHEFIEACQVPGIDLRPTQALRLWRQLGGRVRTDDFLRAWHLEAERRSAWSGVERAS